MSQNGHTYINSILSGYSKNNLLYFYPSLVDGDFTQWSQWSECSLYCGSGTRRRFRRCSPIPRCGGDPCDPDISTMEEEVCSGECKCKLTFLLQNIGKNSLGTIELFFVISSYIPMHS